MTELRIYRDSIFEDALKVAIMDSNKRMYGKIIFRKYNAGEIIQPACIIQRDEAQALMDQLWNCGIRPTEGTGSAGSLAATERHLKDLQRITFHTLKIPKDETK